MRAQGTDEADNLKTTLAANGAVARVVTCQLQVLSVPGSHKSQVPQSVDDHERARTVSQPSVPCT